METTEAIVQANDMLRIECDNLHRENQTLKDKLLKAAANTVVYKLRINGLKEGIRKIAEEIRNIAKEERGE